MCAWKSKNSTTGHPAWVLLLLALPLRLFLWLLSSFWPSSCFDPLFRLISLRDTVTDFTVSVFFFRWPSHRVSASEWREGKAHSLASIWTRRRFRCSLIYFFPIRSLSSFGLISKRIPWSTLICSILLVRFLSSSSVSLLEKSRILIQILFIKIHSRSCRPVWPSARLVIRWTHLSLKKQFCKPNGLLSLRLRLIFLDAPFSPISGLLRESQQLLSFHSDFVLQISISLRKNCK